VLDVVEASVPNPKDRDNLADYDVRIANFAVSTLTAPEGVVRQAAA
jgi:hypothetical protein